MANHVLADDGIGQATGGPELTGVNSYLIHQIREILLYNARGSNRVDWPQRRMESETCDTETAPTRGKSAFDPQRRPLGRRILAGPGARRLQLHGRARWSA